MDINYIFTTIFTLLVTSLPFQKKKSLSNTGCPNYVASFVRFAALKIILSLNTPPSKILQNVLPIIPFGTDIQISFNEKPFISSWPLVKVGI